MKSKKKLGTLKVESFVTSLPQTRVGTVKGGSAGCLTNEECESVVTCTAINCETIDPCQTKFCWTNPLGGSDCCTTLDGNSQGHHCTM